VRSVGRPISCGVVVAGPPSAAPVAHIMLQNRPPPGRSARNRCLGSPRTAAAASWPAEPRILAGALGDAAPRDRGRCPPSVRKTQSTARRRQTPAPRPRWCTRSTSEESHAQDRPRGSERTVRKAMDRIKAEIRGIPSRDSSTARRCRRLRGPAPVPRRDRTNSAGCESGRRPFDCPVSYWPLLELAEPVPRGQARQQVLKPASRPAGAGSS